MRERTGVVHVSALCELAADVGYRAVADMIDIFLASLPDRIARLRHAVSAGDREEGHVAALSLGCSAAMLGATELSDAAARYAAGSGAEQAAALHELEETSVRELRALRRRLAG